MRSFSHIIIVTFSLVFITACSQSDVDTPIDNQEKPLIDVEEEVVENDTEKPPVYVFFNSHNEDSWGPIVNTKDAYFKYRADLLERLNLLDEYGAAFHWQTDITVLLAMQKYEDFEELLDETNGKNILKYMAEDLGFSVDPHLHPKEDTNYADLAYNIELLDVEPSAVIGGSRVFDCSEDPNNPITSIDWHEEIELGSDGVIKAKSSDYEYTPLYLNGAASGGHFYDDHSSGVWKPGSDDDFYVNQEDSDIVYVGEGYPHTSNMSGETHSSGISIPYDGIGYVETLLEKIDNGELDSNGIYTAMFHVRDKETVNGDGFTVNTNEGLAELLNLLAPYVEEGRVVYAHIPEIVEIWENEYDSEPTIVSFDTFSESTEQYKEAFAHCAQLSKKKPKQKL
jgi:hypothetical protein